MKKVSVLEAAQGWVGILREVSVFVRVKGSDDYLEVSESFAFIEFIADGDTQFYTKED